MVAIVDYGVGNLFSLKSSFAAIGQEAVVTADEKVLRSADRIILPGVGAFGDAAKKLKESGMFSLMQTLAREGKPIMGICLGMQLLFEKSYEYGEHEGLGLIQGSIRPIADVIPADLKIPISVGTRCTLPKTPHSSVTSARASLSISFILIMAQTVPKTPSRLLSTVPL